MGALPGRPALLSPPSVRNGTGKARRRPTVYLFSDGRHQITATGREVKIRCTERPP